MQRRNCKGFSTLQFTLGLSLSAVLTGTSLTYLPDILDNADYQVTHYALQTERYQSEVWRTYQMAKGESYEVTHTTEFSGFSAENDLVQSPLGRYCFARNDALARLGLCQELTLE